MNRDMSVPCEEGIINLRVGAIIMKDGKINGEFLRSKELDENDLIAKMV